MTFTGNDAARVGTIVKTTLRDYLKAQIAGAFYRKWGGFDCVTIDEWEGQALPNGKPLLTIQTQRRAFKQLGRGAGRRVEFVIEISAIADGASGALVDNLNPTASDEQLSDDVETILSSEAARSALATLGLQAVQVGERRETVRDGLHANTTMVTLAALLA